MDLGLRNIIQVVREREIWVGIGLIKEAINMRESTIVIVIIITIAKMKDSIGILLGRKNMIIKNIHIISSMRKEGIKRRKRMN